MEVRALRKTNSLVVPLLVANTVSHSLIASGTVSSIGKITCHGCCSRSVTDIISTCEVILVIWGIDKRNNKKRDKI